MQKSMRITKALILVLFIASLLFASSAAYAQNEENMPLQSATPDELLSQLENNEYQGENDLQIILAQLGQKVDNINTYHSFRSVYKQKEKQNTVDFLNRLDSVMEDKMKTNEYDDSLKYSFLGVQYQLCQKYWTLSEDERAVKACERDFARQTDNRFPIDAVEAESWLNSARSLLDAYKFTGEKEKGLALLSQVEDISKQFDLLNSMSMGSYWTHPLMILASNYLVYGEYDKSVKYYRELVKRLEVGLPSLYFSAKGELGKALFLDGNTEEAEENIVAALSDFEQRREESYSKPEGERFGSGTVADNDFNNDLYNTLQKIKVKQGKDEEALLLAESNRTENLFRNLSSNSNNYPLDMEQIKSIAKQQNTTLIEYSFAPSYYRTMNEEDSLFVWVIKPDGTINFRSIEADDILKAARSDNHGRAIYSSTISLFPLLLFFFIVIGILCLFNSRSSTAITWFKSICLFVVCFALVVSCSADKPSSNRSAQTNVENGLSAEQAAVSQSSKIKLEPLIEDTLKYINQELKKEDLSTEYCNSSEQCLHTLYTYLIEPIEDLLPNNFDERVIFLPEFTLNKIPFAALIDRKDKYLIDRYVISTAPSLRVLNVLSQKNNQSKIFTENASTKAVVVGNPATMERVGIPLDFVDEESLPPLPGAEEEAKLVAQLLGAEPILGQEAIETAVTEPMPKSNIIHFATHGLLEAKGVGLDALILTPTDRYSEDNDPYDGIDSSDGLLTTEEIANLNLSADLVVMSACDTGLGYNTTDGVLGLVRSFFSAGVPSAVASLWTVPDAPTKELMVKFYQNLKANPDKAQALRQAMLATKNEHPEPYDWAAFTLIGKAT